MDKHRVFRMDFTGVLPHFVTKAEKKSRTKQEVDRVICIEEIGHPLMKQFRCMDKLVDEHAKLRPMAKVLRG